MKKIITYFYPLILLCTIWTNAQTIGEDSEGYSTLIGFQSGVDINILEKRGSIDFTTPLVGNKYRNALEGGYVILGGQLSASLDNDRGVLFDSGELSSRANGNLFIGWEHRSDSKSNHFKDEIDSIEKKIKSIDSAQIELIRNIEIKPKDSTKKDSIKKDSIKKDSTRYMASIDSIRFPYQCKSLKSDSIDSLKVDLCYLYFANSPDTVLIDIGTIERKIDLINESNKDNPIEIIWNKYELVRNKQSKKSLRKDKNSLMLKSSHTRIWRLLGYAGFDGEQFNLDRNNGMLTSTDRIETRSRAYHRVGITGNIQLDFKHFFGVSVENRRMNNLDALGTSDITFTSSFSEGGNTTTQTNTISAFPLADFQEFNRTSINFDYAHLFPIGLGNQGDWNGNYLSLNPYFRYHLYSNSVSYEPQMNLGLGLYFYNPSKKKISGGLYAQWNDLTNQNESNPVDSSFQVGLITRYSLSSLIGSKN